jgi:hypothetical protein
MAGIRKGFLLFFWVSVIPVILFRCNIEVGNPESETSGPIRSVQSFSLNLAATTSCENSATPCASVPIVTGDASDNLKFELSQVNLGLSGVTFKPMAEESSITTVDLLRGATIEVKNSLSTLNMDAVALRFSTAEGKNAASVYLEGVITGMWSGERVRVPLSLSYRSEFIGETVVVPEDAVLETVLFDPQVWFDFSATGNEFYRLLKSANSGACRSYDAGSCIQYRENLARQISMRISRSMSVKTRANSGKSAGKKVIP